ncbi:hypothetical protein [Actinomadura sp. 6N118]|uniref:hypothetical protein n=1 Tax=Actinomadura sp. 6N118 TaxID=3375151 RepID=UPI0037A711E5
MGNVSEASRCGASSDPAVLLAELHRQYPEVRAWLGKATGRWWAMLPGYDRLVEAGSAQLLARRLNELGARRAPVEIVPLAQPVVVDAWVGALWGPDRAAGAGSVGWRAW